MTKIKSQAQLQIQLPMFLSEVYRQVRSEAIKQGIAIAKVLKAKGQKYDY